MVAGFKPRTLDPKPCETTVKPRNDRMADRSAIGKLRKKQIKNLYIDFFVLSHFLLRLRNSREREFLCFVFQSVAKQGKATNPTEPCPKRQKFFWSSPNQGPE